MFGDLLSSVGELILDFVTGLFRALIAPFIEGIFGGGNGDGIEL